MPGGSGDQFNGDPPPRARTIPWDRIVAHHSRGQSERRDTTYEFSNRRQFREPVVPGIYDPSSDVL